MEFSVCSKELFEDSLIPQPILLLLNSHQNVTLDTCSEECCNNPIIMNELSIGDYAITLTPTEIEDQSWTPIESTVKVNCITESPTMEPTANPTADPSPITTNSVTCNRQISGIFEEEQIIYRLTLSSQRTVTFDACDSDFDPIIIVTNATNNIIKQCEDDCCELTKNLSAGIWYFEFDINPNGEFESEGLLTYTISINCESDSPTIDPTIEPTVVPTVVPSGFPTEASSEEVIVIEPSNITNFSTSAVPNSVDDEPKMGVWVWVIIIIGIFCCMLLVLFLILNRLKREKEAPAVCTDDIRLEEMNKPSRAYSHGSSDEECENSEIQRFMEESVVVDDADYQ